MNIGRAARRPSVSSHYSTTTTAVSVGPHAIYPTDMIPSGTQTGMIQPMGSLPPLEMTADNLAVYGHSNLVSMASETMAGRCTPLCTDGMLLAQPPPPITHTIHMTGYLPPAHGAPTIIPVSEPPTLVSVTEQGNIVYAEQQFTPAAVPTLIQVPPTYVDTAGTTTGCIQSASASTAYAETTMVYTEAPVLPSDGTYTLSSEAASASTETQENWASDLKLKEQPPLMTPLTPPASSAAEWDKPTENPASDDADENSTNVTLSTQ